MRNRKTLNELHQVTKKLQENRQAHSEFRSNYSYFARHIPTGEDWYILGVDPDHDRVCAGGYPPSIGKLSDCCNFTENKSLTDEELKHRTRKFGSNWL